MCPLRRPRLSHPARVVSGGLYAFGDGTNVEMYGAAVGRGGPGLVWDGGGAVR